MAILKISLTPNEEIFIANYINEGKAKTKIEVIIKALENLKKTEKSRTK